MSEQVKEKVSPDNQGLAKTETKAKAPVKTIKLVSDFCYVCARKILEDGHIHLVQSQKVGLGVHKRCKRIYLKEINLEADAT